jgi:hypothetical protein
MSGKYWIIAQCIFVVVFVVVFIIVMFESAE